MRKGIPLPRFYTHAKMVRQTEHIFPESTYRVTSYQAPEPYETVDGIFLGRIEVSVLPNNPMWQGGGYRDISTTYCTTPTQLNKVHDEIVDDLTVRGIGVALGTYKK